MWKTGAAEIRPAKKTAAKRYPFLEELAQRVEACLSEQATVLVCVMGKSGVGKSTLGRFLRTRGFGRFKPRDLGIIESDFWKTNVGGFFRRKIHRPSAGVDELEPFRQYYRGKKVVFFIHRRPEMRVTRADIVLRLTTSEQTRLARLRKRNGPADGARRFERTAGMESETRINISYRFLIEWQL
jgi:hypothetical protein